MKLPRLRSWSKMKAVEKRRAIARDVIAQLKAGTYWAETGLFLGINGPHEPGCDIRNGIIKRIDHCQVCARGAVFVSYVRLFDKEQALPNLNIQASGATMWRSSSGRYRFPLTGLFGGTLGLMEDYFEEPENFDWNEDDSTERMLAIMRNVVRHGNFKPKLSGPWLAKVAR